MSNDIDNIFHSRPFKIRNADEYDLVNILSLFVSPLDGMLTPFDYENTIIKGRMGSGKTMYLRANHAFYLYGIIPSLLEDNSELVLPVFIKLNDFQHLTEPSEIYRAIILKIIEELSSIYLYLHDAKRLAQLHSGISLLPANLFSAHKHSKAMSTLAKLESDEYIEKVSAELGYSGGLKPKFFECSAQWKETELIELKKKPNPGIKDIEDCYRNLLQNQEGKILLLIDEAGSLDKRFFQGDNNKASLFEILMNQFRTAPYIRTKIAVYPNSYSDMLTETRYGDVARLEENVIEERGFVRFRNRVYELIKNYLNPDPQMDYAILPEDIFEISGEPIYGDCLEQLLYASNGNMRRLIHLLDSSMNAAYRVDGRAKKITKEHVLEALRDHAENTESLFSEQEKDFLNNIIAVCKSRGCYKFQFPKMSPILYKYTSRSQEYNIVNVAELGSGRRSTIYSFDYAYTVLRDIPTHHFADSEKINRDRTLGNGKWIKRVAQISEEILVQAAFPGKIEGEISYLHENSGFLTGDNNEQYFFTESHILEPDRNKILFVGKRVRFYPALLGETKAAINIEVL